MMRNSLFLLSLFILFISACKKEENGPQRSVSTPNQTEYTEGIFLLNEGSFGNNNASLTHLNLKTDELTNDVYAAANDGKVLGDVLQSMVVDGERTYLVVNNSNKIEVVASGNLKHLGTISGLNSPRYMQMINSTKAYVSNLSFGTDGLLQIIDPENQIVTGSIEMNGWTERMLLHNNELFVCNMTRGSVQVVDIQSNQITRELIVGKSPGGLTIDKYDNIWVLCSGGFQEEIPTIYQIKPSNYDVFEFPLNFTIDQSPSNLQMNFDKDSLYFLDDDVYGMSVENPVAGPVRIVELSELTYPYSLFVSGIENELFVTDAVDFQNDGKLMRYNSKGELMNQYDVGKGPSFMHRLDN